MNFKRPDEELFARIRDLPKGEQYSILHELSYDQAQIDRVQLLLYADQSPDSLLDTTAMHALEETDEGRSVPKSIGDFEILGELGRGGMGIVYEARQKSLKRKVALKVLSSGLGLSSKAILRFRREAEAAGKLHHTNIVPIYTTGEDKGIHFYAMELIEGPSLDQVIKERKRAEIEDEPLAATASQASRSGDSEKRAPSNHTKGESPSTEAGTNADANVSSSTARLHLNNFGHRLFR